MNRIFGCAPVLAAVLCLAGCDVDNGDDTTPTSTSTLHDRGVEVQIDAETPG